MTNTNYSVAVNECENCGKACETLHDLSDGWNFKACDQCAEDAAREDAREAEELRKLCVNCKTNAARPDSIYCSDRCRNAFLYFPEEPKPPKFTIVERWDGQKWIEVRLEWNGTEYKESK